jgi:hypothetical protein
LEVLKWKPSNLREAARALLFAFTGEASPRFDSTLQRGLIHDVKVTPLRGNNWTPGPVAEKQIASAVSTD